MTRPPTEAAWRAQRLGAGQACSSAPLISTMQLRPGRRASRACDRTDLAIRRYPPRSRDAMAGEQRTKRNDLPLCPRCKAGQMAEIVTIAPLIHEPGLVAYECPNCGYVASEIQP